MAANIFKVFSRGPAVEKDEFACVDFNWILRPSPRSEKVNRGEGYKGVRRRASLRYTVVEKSEFVCGEERSDAWPWASGRRRRRSTARIVLGSQVVSVIGFYFRREVVDGPSLLCVHT